MSETKYARLLELLRGMESVVVAFSGGVDSSFLAFVANRVLGNRAVAITADSPSLAWSELEEARAFARAYGREPPIIVVRPGGGARVERVR